MNQTLPPNSETTVVEVDEVQMKQFQSLYYLIKGKRDTDIKLYTEIKQFSFDDIVELNDKIYRILALHHLVTDIVNVTIGFEDKEIKTFGNWTEFKKTDWNISSRTKYITIEWDFNLVLPNQFHKIPQTHTMRIRIGNNLKPSEMIQVVFQGDAEYELEEAQSLMSCKIDFINSQICNQLKGVVDEWYKSLRINSEDHKLIQLILKFVGVIKAFVIFTFITSCIIFLNFLFKISVTSNITFLPSDSSQKMFLFITGSIVFYIFYKLGSQISDRMMRKQIGKLKRNPIFEITKGDKNRFAEVKKENSKYLKGLAFTIIIGLATNGLSALIGLIIENLTNK